MRPYADPLTWMSFQLDLARLPSTCWLDLGELVAGVRALEHTALGLAEGRAVVRDLTAQAIIARCALDGLAVPPTTIHQLLAGDPKGAGTIPVGMQLEAFVSASGGHSGSVVLTTPRPIDAPYLATIHARACGSEAGSSPAPWRSTTPDGKPWEGVPHEVIIPFVEDLLEWLNSADLAAPTAELDAPYRVIRCVLAELYLAWIRPFSTGHHRVMALLVEGILHGASSASTTGQLLSMALYTSGSRYAEELGAAARTSDPLGFLTFCIRAMVDELRSVQHRIGRLQQHGQWRAQLLDLFQEGNDAPTRRQRQVLLDLADANGPVPLSRISTLSPALAALYAGVSEKTLRRDMDALVQAGLVQRGPSGLRIDLNTLLVFNR